jgi:hypothetical protein
MLSYRERHAGPFLELSRYDGSSLPSASQRRGIDAWIERQPVLGRVAEQRGCCSHGLASTFAGQRVVEVSARDPWWPREGPVSDEGCDDPRFSTHARPIIPRGSRARKPFLGDVLVAQVHHYGRGIATYL